MRPAVAALGHELLLLMLNLSRMRDQRQILRLFVEALGAARTGVPVRLLDAGESSDAEIVDIATPETCFGRIALEDPSGTLSSDERALFRNAALMLAVVLENNHREVQLAAENARLESAVAARTAELRGALDRSDDLYQHAPCGYHSLDGEGRLLQLNDTELRWLGFEPHELPPSPPFHELVAPESRALFARTLATLRATGRAPDVEVELLRKGGERLPVLMSATAVRAADGALVEARFTILDHSARRRVELALHDSEERLRKSQKLEALGRLAGGIAHDFNNLLTIILGYGDDLAAERALPERLRREATEIVEAGRRAAQLTRQLLAFGRRQPSRPVSVDLGELVAGMEKMLRRLIGEDVELAIVRGGGLRRIHADPAQIEQVVLNLVVNARDAMEGRGGCIRIETANVDVVPDADQWLELEPLVLVRLVVADDGCGMSAEVRERLFEPFFTTKPEGKGTGLGLATVYGNVKLAGGEIHVESAKGLGSRFEVVFPSTSDAVENEAEPPSAPLSSRGRETLLLVEDDADVREIAGVTLRRAGYVVLEADDGEAALELAAELGRLDGLVSDIVMPRLGGLELAARLRARRGDLAVVLMSGYPSAGLAGAELEKIGEGAIVAKPFTAAALTTAVRAALDARTARRQAGASRRAPPAA